MNRIEAWNHIIEELDAKTLEKADGLSVNELLEMIYKNYRESFDSFVEHKQTVKCEVELDYKTAQVLLGAIKQISCDMEMGECPTYWDDNNPDYNKNEDFEVAEKVEERNGTIVKNFLKKVLQDSKADELLLDVIFLK